MSLEKLSKNIMFQIFFIYFEIDEQWSFVKKKSNQRWLWYAVDHATNKILTYVPGKRKDIVFKQLKALKKANIKIQNKVFFLVYFFQKKTRLSSCRRITFMFC